VTMKSAVFWDVTPWGSCMNRQVPLGVTSQKTALFKLKTTFRKQDLSLYSGERMDTSTLWEPSRTVQWLRLALCKGPMKVGGPLPSPEDGNVLSLGNVVFF
jgi:hypothetical protein